MCAFALNASAQITAVTQQQAFEQVSKLFEDRDVDYYTATSKTNPEEDLWVFFVDANPMAMWEHECYLVYVPKTSAVPLDKDSIICIERKMPPSDYTRDPYLVKQREEESDDSPMVIEPSLKNDNETFLGQYSGNTYAVIISGSVNIQSNSYVFWNNCSLMYQILTKKFGIPKTNIYPLISDGNNPGVDMLNKRKKEVSSPLDLDNDGIPELELAASKENVQYIFNMLTSKLKKDDHLFVYFTNHGTRADGGTHPTYVGLYESGEVTTEHSYISHKEIAQLLNPFIKEKVNVNVLIGCCHSGGLIDNLSNDRCVVNASCETDTVAYLSESLGYGIFDYYWMCAVNGKDKDKKIVDADYDKDGYVSMNEAYRYATINTAVRLKKNELYPKTQYPQYLSNPEKLGKQLAFNRMPILTDNFKLGFSDKISYLSDGKKQVDAFWYSPDIIIRNSFADMESDVNENPVFTDTDRTCIVKVRVHNNGEDAYMGEGKSLIVYWAQASTNISSKDWLGQNNYNSSYPTGGIIGKGKITKIIEPGASFIQKFFWTCPKSVFEEASRPDNHRFCFYAKVVDDDQEADNIMFDALNNDTAIQSNVSLIYNNDAVMASTVFVGNDKDTQERYILELGFRTQEDQEIFKYAHVALDMNGTLFNAWYNRGHAWSHAIAEYGRSPYSVEFTDPDSELRNITFLPNGCGRGTLYTDFFNAPFRKQTYTIDLIQRTMDGKIVGGETFIVESPVKQHTQISTDSIIHRNGSMDLMVNIDDSSNAKWFNADNKYVGSGKTLSLSPKMRNGQYSVVVTTEDGELSQDYAETYSQLGICNISYNANSDYVDITTFDGDIEGYCITVTSLTSGSEVYSTQLPAGETGLRIDTSSFVPDIYVINCALGENMLNTYKFRKQ